MTTFTVARTGTTLDALKPEGIRQAAPSVYAEHARPGVSEHYSFISTVEVIELLRNDGWEPVKVREQRVRLMEKIGFQLHEVRFARRVDLGSVAKVGQMRPEMILQNSHDGTRAYRIDAGLFRLVCSNGLVVADAEFAKVCIRHSRTAPETFRAAAKAVAESAPRVAEVIERWRQVSLSPAAKVEFARRASMLRWHPEQPIAKSVTPAMLVTPQRGDDSRDDLWTVFNVVQEHLVRGGDSYRTLQPGHPVRRGMTRPIMGLQQGQALNKQLWELAEWFSRN